MAIPAGLALTLLYPNITYHSGFDKLCIELRVAPDAIVHDHPFAGIAGTDHHWLSLHGKNGRVVKPIHSLESIFTEGIVLWYMAVVAMCPYCMRTALPRLEIGGHDVAVDTGRGGVGEVAVCARHMESIPHQPRCGAPKNKKGHNKIVGDGVQESFH